MPSALPIPGIREHLAAAAGQLTGERDRYADTVSGSIYNNIYGPTAILFAREADRDSDGFRSIYVDDADGDQLATLIEGRYGVARVLDTYGSGIATLIRASSAAGAGVVLAGTRIAIQGMPPTEYTVSQDTVVGTGESLTVDHVPVRSGVTGPGTSTNVSAGLSFEDPVYDPLWRPVALVCGDGTSYEAAPDYRARVRQHRLDQRNGYIKELTLACQAVGASHVIAFASSYGLDANNFDVDFGLNAIYVADANFVSTPALVNACEVALDGVRVLGADLWVGGIAQSALPVVATVSLVDDPGKLPRVPILQACVQAIVREFSPTSSGYIVHRTGIAGAMIASSPSVQSVAFAAPSADVLLSPTNFPATLTRYVVTPNSIRLSLVGPS